MNHIEALFFPCIIFGVMAIANFAAPLVYRWRRNPREKTVLEYFGTGIIFGAMAIPSLLRLRHSALELKPFIPFEAMGFGILLVLVGWITRWKRLRTAAAEAYRAQNGLPQTTDAPVPDAEMQKRRFLAASTSMAACVIWFGFFACIGFMRGFTTVREPWAERMVTGWYTEIAIFFILGVILTPFAVYFQRRFLSSYHPTAPREQVLRKGYVIGIVMMVVYIVFFGIMVILTMPHAGSRFR